MVTSAFVCIDPAVNKTPGTTGSYQTVDVSANGVPAGASSAILDLHNLSGSSVMNIAVRKKGSAEDDYASSTLRILRHHYALVPLDANLQFECKINDSTNCRVWLVGYTTSAVVFLDTRVDKTPAGTGWTDITCGEAAAGSVGAIFKLISTGAAATRISVRCNGSTFDKNADSKLYDYHSIWAMCGLDVDKKAEGYLSTTTATKIYLIGYVTGGSGVTFLVNPLDKSPAAQQAWTDVDLTVSTSAAADFAIFELINEYDAENDAIEVRKNGSTDARQADAQVYADGHVWGLCGLDAGQIFEGYIKYSSGTYNRIWLHGWAEPSAALAFTVTDAGVGTETSTVPAAIPITDPGTGTDTPSLAATIPMTDQAVGADAALPIPATLPMTDQGVAVDSPLIAATLLLQESGLGADECGAIILAAITDSGIGTDQALIATAVSVLDDGLGADRAYLLVWQTKIGGFVFLHIDSIDITDPSIVATHPQEGTPPRRMWKGRRGREVTIKGRADTNVEVESIKALNNGEKHLAIIPTGNSFYVIVSQVQPDKKATGTDQIPYVVMAKETIE